MCTSTLNYFHNSHPRLKNAVFETRQATQPNRLSKMPLPGKSIWAWLLTFCIPVIIITLGIYCKMCLLHFVTINQTVLEISCRRNFCDLLRPHKTWTFDLLIHNVSCSCRADYLCQLASKLVHLFSKHCVHKFSSRTDMSRTICLSAYRCDRHVKNNMPLPTNVTRRRHKNLYYRNLVHQPNSERKQESQNINK